MLFRFTARGSAAAMSHLCFDKMSQRTRQDVRALFLKLCSDETPFVRRAAAQNIINMIRVHRQMDVSAEGAAVMEFVEAFKSFARDDQVGNQCLSKGDSPHSCCSAGFGPYTGYSDSYCIAGLRFNRCEGAVVRSAVHVFVAHPSVFALQLNHVLPVVLQIAGDQSWRVRWSLANQLFEVLRCLDGDAQSGATSLASVFDALLNDTEPEVTRF